MEYADYIKSLIEKDGGIIISVTFRDSAGGIIHKTEDEVVTEVIMQDGFITYVPAEGARIHIQNVMDITREEDEVTITTDTNKQLHLGPLWLSSQLAMAKKWQESPDAAVFKAKAKELFDEVSR